MNKIVFFSKEDLAYHSMMGKINVFFENNFHKKESYLLNEILELHHICEYIDHGFVYKDWNSEQIQQIKSTIKEFKKKINIFFNQMTIESLVDIFEEIEYDYLKTFWLLVNRFNFFEKISTENLQVLFRKKKFNISHLLYCNRIVVFFDSEIKDFILGDEKNAEILLDYFEKSHDRKPQEKFFPKSLTSKDCENLISKYIDYENPNLNYLRLIVKSKDSDFLVLSDRIKLKAKRLSDKINNDLLNSENAIVIRQGVSLSDDQEEVKKIIYKDNEPITSYSRKRLSEKTDKITLLKNYRNIFDYIDFQGCINLVSHSKEIDGFESSFIRSRNEYFISSAFHYKSLESTMNFEIYKHFLDSIDIKHEDILEDYVNDYLNKTFNINFLKLHLPSSNSSILEKIRLIVPEFEHLIEQYKLYVEDDFVDFELLQVSTKTSGFEKIPSLVEKKYVYPIGDEFQKLKYNFFSNMSPLFDYNKFNEKYLCFYHALRFEKINIEDYKDYDRKYIQHFIDNKYLKIDDDGNIALCNPNFLSIIGYLDEYDVVSYWYFPKSFRDEIDKMAEEKMIRFSDKLFTKAEQDYFNYYLNNRFSNGLWLRNKYVHATNSHDEKEQENDYKILIKLLVLLILKIDDDLNITKSIIVAYQKNN